MYHPTRGGVRGGRDQFSWEDVKIDKHRENYLGHSIKAPVGRWQKGKDLHWYTRDKTTADMQAVSEEIKIIKEREEQAMREALGLAPKRASRPQGNRLDKHEFSELVKRGSTAEDLGEGHAEAAQVQGVGFSRGPSVLEASSYLQPSLNDIPSEKVKAAPMPKPSPAGDGNGESEDESSRSRKRRREEKKREKHEKRERRHAHDSDDKRSRKREKERKRHDSY